jgi:DNA replication and repair protein RecF
MPQVQSCCFKTLKLQNFRNFCSLNIKIPKDPVIIAGPNGIGKTSILEAVSLFSPGKGFRQSKLSVLKKSDAMEMGWSVNADLFHQDQDINIGTGLDISTPLDRRIVKVNGEKASQASLNDWVKILWQTPQMDRLFIDGTTIRRKFFDKLLVNFSPDHSKHLYRYDYALRERSKLLREGIKDPKWLSVLEKKMAEESIAITVNRLDYLSQLKGFLEQEIEGFPKISVSLQGDVEFLIQEKSATEAEECLQERLFHLRERDAITGGSKIGAHQSEFIVLNLDCNQQAEVCSTGEQKALLLTLIMANARLLATVHETTPVLLLDEVVAHLDENRRQVLFKEILKLGIQSWLTGTDEQVFEPLRKHAHFINLTER